MDGNNRWARQRGLSGTAGHRAGIERLRDMLDGCRQHDIDVLTVFAFSSENWKRPPREVSALMSLFNHYLTSEAKRLRKEKVRLLVVGSRQRFDKSLVKAIEKAEAVTADGERTLVIAADYGGRWDIVNAAKAIAHKAVSGDVAVDDIDEQQFNEHTSLAGLPALDLLIRTGGEYRISNFLLWQAAYAELYFSDLLWPDFDLAALTEAVNSFHHRERRYGLNAEQLAALKQARSGQ